MKWPSDIATMPLDGLRQLMELAGVEAVIAGRNTVALPRAAVERMLADLEAQRAGRSLTPRGRQPLSWRDASFRQVAIERYRARRAELRAQGRNAADAEAIAADEVSKGALIDAKTLIHLAKYRQK